MDIMLILQIIVLFGGIYLGVKLGGMGIGYEKSASIAKEALQTGKAVGDICLERGYLKKEEIDKILEPKNMLNPHMGK